MTSTFRRGEKANSASQGASNHTSHNAMTYSAISALQKENPEGMEPQVKSKIHYNSDKPAQLSTLVYAHGTDIHIAPGQERHLPHEAWHVVQQKQERARSATQAKGVAINDDERLEKEADVMGEKVMQAKVREIHPVPTAVTEWRPYTIQRIRIKLKDEDPILMGRLRNVPVTNEGNEKLDQITDAPKAHEIGSSENIILEGHGYLNDPLFGSPKVVSQGGISPSKLAAIANSIAKPKDWNGNIILAGCTTGDITDSVSKEYYKLTNKSVNVIGTLKNIRIGSKEDGTNFIGSDWGKYPERERPDDLAFIDEVKKATEDFWGNIKTLAAFARQLEAYKNGQRKDIALSIAPIEQVCARITSIDNDSRSIQTKNKNYKLDKRTELYNFFEDCIIKLKAVSFFVYPDKVQPIVNLYQENKQFNEFTNALLLLSQQGALYQEIGFYLTGLKLKEIDLFDPANTKHSKLKRTKESIFGDTWEDDH